MKLTILLFLSSVGLAFSNPLELEKKIANTYNAGIKAMKTGDFNTAEQYLKAVVQASPNHGNALHALKQIESKKALSKQTKSISSLNGIYIKEIDLDQTPFRDALATLSLLIDKNNGDDVGAPNFSIVDPDNNLSEKNITLKLGNLPAKNILNYMLESVGARADYGEFIITIRPL